jgi:hypothetical protein
LSEFKGKSLSAGSSEEAGSPPGRISLKQLWSTRLSFLSLEILKWHGALMPGHLQLLLLQLNRLMHVAISEELLLRDFSFLPCFVSIGQKKGRFSGLFRKHFD